MNKAKKAIASIIVLIIIFSSVTFSVFGAKVADGTAPFEVFNDKFYAVVPEGFVICYNKNNYEFMSDRAVDTYYISFFCYDNENGINALALSSPQEQYAFFESVLKKSLKSYAEELDIEKFYTLNSNGCPCLVAEIETESGDNEELNGICYLITGKTGIYLIKLECYGDFPADEAATVVNSFSINDERFSGEVETNHKDFTDAFPLESALENDVVSYDEAVYGNGAREDLGAIDPDDIDSAAEIAIVVTMMLIFAVPFLIVTVLAIVFICKYVKTKKKLREYEANYGNI